MVAAEGLPATTEAAQAAAATASLPAVRLAADAAFLSRALHTQSRLVIAAASMAPHPQRPASAATLLDHPLVASLLDSLTMDSSSASDLNSDG